MFTYSKASKNVTALSVFLLNDQHALDGNPKAVDGIAQKQNASKDAPSTIQINTTW